MIKQRLTGSGFASLQTLSVGETVSNSLTAAGSTQANAVLLGDDINVFTTTGASTGCILPSTLVASGGDKITVINYGANALSVYPPTGGKINNGTTNAAVSLAANKSGIFISIDGTNYAYTITA